MSTGTVTVMVWLSATCDRVKRGSPSTKFDQAKTIAEQGAAASKMRPAGYKDYRQTRTHHAVTVRFKVVSATGVPAHATVLPWQQFSAR